MLVNAVATKNGMLTVHLIRHGLMWSSTSAVRLTGWVCRVHNSRKFTSRPVNESDLVHSISGEIRRKQTAAQLLRLIAGRPLEDKQRVRTTFQQLATGRNKIQPAQKPYCTGKATACCCTFSSCNTRTSALADPRERCATQRSSSRASGARQHHLPSSRC